jgi:hypothetical protein
MTERDRLQMQYDFDERGRQADSARESQMFDRRVAANNASRQSALDAFNSQMQTIYGAPIGAGGAGAGTPAMNEDELAQFEAMQYGRAKEQIGRQKLAALSAFRDQLADRGMHGSTLEAAGIGDVIGEGEDELGDVVMQQAGSRINRAREVSDNAARVMEDRRKMAASMLADVLSRGGALY